MAKRTLTIGLFVALIAAACGSDGTPEAADDISLGVERRPDVVSPIEVVDSSYEGIDYNAAPLGNAINEFISGGLESDFPEALVDISDVRPGFGQFFDGMLDRIPPIDEPEYVSVSEATYLAGDQEPVIFVEINGDARAYPLKVLISHEIVNTEIGDIPVSVTFCPLCNSALAVDRRVGERVLDFGVSGTLLNSALLMYDRQTGSLWSHFTGEGTVGHFAGAKLELIPSQTISFGQFRESFPDGLVLSELSEENSSPGRYGANPYVGYDSPGQIGFLFDGEFDDRLAAEERVVGIDFEGEAIAIPFEQASEAGVIELTIGDGTDVVVLHESGVSSALDSDQVHTGRDVGQSGVFISEFDGEQLELTKTAAGFEDQLGNTWNILGTAIDGPATGESLQPITHLDAFWFAWAAYRPDTNVLSHEDGSHEGRSTLAPPRWGELGSYQSCEILSEL